jgi:hypothetical protein
MVFIDKRVCDFFALRSIFQKKMCVCELFGFSLLSVAGVLLVGLIVVWRKKTNTDSEYTPLRSFWVETYTGYE